MHIISRWWTIKKLIQKCYHWLNFVPQHLLPVLPSWRNKVCEVVVVRSSTKNFLVPVLNTSSLLHSPESICSIRQRSWLTPWMFTCILSSSMKIIVKRSADEKFRTRRINNKLCQILKSRWDYVFFSFRWMKNSLLERDTILKSSSRNSESILMTCLSISFLLYKHFSFRVAAPNLHVSPKTYLA